MSRELKAALFCFAVGIIGLVLLLLSGCAAKHHYDISCPFNHPCAVREAKR